MKKANPYFLYLSGIINENQYHELIENKDNNQNENAENPSPNVLFHKKSKHSDVMKRMRARMKVLQKQDPNLKRKRRVDPIKQNNAPQDPVEWAKETAMAYVEKGDLNNAVNSMISDMNKISPSPLLWKLALNVDRTNRQQVIDFIMGF
jgi:hypothetical protein